mgnify:CR=1 FL=1
MQVCRTFNQYFKFMKKLLFTLITLFFANSSFSQSIDGKWIYELVPGQIPNTMYEFKDGLRYTYYCNDFENGCDEDYWNSLEISDALPGPNSYTFLNNTLTIDINFGNYWTQEVSFECGGNIISFENSDLYNWWRVGTDLEACQLVDSCVAIPIDGCFAIDLWDPVCGCDGVTYSNTAIAACNSILNSTSGECNLQENCCINPDWINPNAFCSSLWAPVIGCDGIEYNNSCVAQAAGLTSWTDESGISSALDWDCETGEALCISYTGAEIYESGDWVNPNDPCDFGYCNEDGSFVGVIIDCQEMMGVACEGEWVLEDGACCSTCIENTDSDCGGISITLNNGWNIIGFSCSENTDVIEAFSSIQDKIVIAKDAEGNAYLPSFNFNGIGDLERGYGYVIKVTEAIIDYNICD